MKLVTFSLHFLSSVVSVIYKHATGYIPTVWDKFKIISLVTNDPFAKKEDLFNYDKPYVQVVGNADAFKDDDVCNGVNGAEVTNGEAVVDEEGIFELSYYLDNKGDNPLPNDALVPDVVAYKASLTTYPILHIVD